MADGRFLVAGGERRDMRIGVRGWRQVRHAAEAHHRIEPREPGVYFSPWSDATATLGVTVPLVTGFQSDAGSRWGRSVTAVPGGDGSLYITDDDAGLVYRISPSD